MWNSKRDLRCLLYRAGWVLQRKSITDLKVADFRVDPTYRNEKCIDRHLWPITDPRGHSDGWSRGCSLERTSLLHQPEERSVNRGVLTCKLPLFYLRRIWKYWIRTFSTSDCLKWSGDRRPPTHPVLNYRFLSVNQFHHLLKSFSNLLYSYNEFRRVFWDPCSRTISWPEGYPFVLLPVILNSITTFDRLGS